MGGIIQFAVVFLGKLHQSVFLCDTIMEPIRILIVGDDAGKVEFLQSFMGAYPAFEIEGRYLLVPRAVEAARHTQPHVGIIQVSQPGFSGYETTRQLHQACPEMQMLWYSSFDKEEHLLGALRVGAKGYLLENAPPHRLLEAIEEIVAGGAPISPSMTRMLVDYVQGFHNNSSFQLSDRERSILKNLVDGIPIKLIAPMVFLSEDGVKKNLRNIYGKLKVNNGKEAVAKAIRERIV